jgi:hypothetical protein
MRLISIIAGLLVSGGLWAAPPEVRPVRMRVPFRAPGELLNAGDVTVKLNGMAAKVSRLMRPGDDLLVLIGVDFSGDLTLIDPARETLLKQLETLPPTVRVGLLRSGDELRVMEEPSASREALAAALQALTVSARPGLLNSLEATQQLADAIAAKAQVRVATLWISDSNVARYREDYTNPVVNSSDGGDMSRRFPEGLIQERIRQLTASLNRGETPVSLVHLQYQGDRLNTAYQTGLNELMRASGGTSDFCRSVAEIPPAVEKALEQILMQYTAEVEFPLAKAKQLDVVVEAGDREVQFRARRRLPEAAAKRSSE